MPEHGADVEHRLGRGSSDPTPAEAERTNGSWVSQAQPEDGEAERGEQHEDGSDAEEAELLADDREDEVGVRLGQPAPLLAAGAQARRPTSRRCRARTGPAAPASRSRAGRRPGSSHDVKRCMPVGSGDGEEHDAGHAGRRP